MDRHRLLLILVGVALAPFTTLRLYGADEIQYFAYLRSVVYDGDLDFSNEYLWFADGDPEAYAGFRRTFLETKTHAGRAPNNAPIGTAFLWSPFYLAAITLGAGRSDSAMLPGVSRLAVGAVCVASMIYGVFGLLLTNGICRSFASAAAAFWSTILVWFATNLLFYMYVTPPMSHACSFFATALFLWWWLRKKGSDNFLTGKTPPALGLSEKLSDPFFNLVLGALGGLMASVRWQDALFLSVPVVGPLLSGSVRSVRDARRWLVSSACIGIGFLIAFTPQMLVWIHLNGSLTPLGVVPVKGRFDFAAPYLFGVLFSSFHGLVVWTPVVVPAFVGLAALAMRDGRGRALLLGVSLQIFLLSGYVVAFGHGFGQRLFISSLPAMAVGLAVFGARASAFVFHAGVAAGGALAILWNLGLLVQHGTGMIPRNEGVPLPVLVRNQFVEVPKLVPAVLARYLLDRDSFFVVDPLRDADRRSD